MRHRFASVPSQSGYKRGCRCDECREIARVARRDRRNRSRAARSPAYLRELAAARACKERYRGTCTSCGASTTGGDGPGTAPELCCHCAPAVYGPLTRGRGEVYAQAHRLLQRGPLRFVELRDALGYRNRQLSPVLAYWIKQGYVRRIRRGLYELAPGAPAPRAAARRAA